MALQRVAAGGSSAWWGAQGFASARWAQFPLATVATGGRVACGAGIQRGDLARAGCGRRTVRSLIITRSNRSGSAARSSRRLDGTRDEARSERDVALGADFGQNTVLPYETRNSRRGKK